MSIDFSLFPPAAYAYDPVYDPAYYDPYYYYGPPYYPVAPAIGFGIGLGLGGRGFRHRGFGRRGFGGFRGGFRRSRARARRGRSGRFVRSRARGEGDEEDEGSESQYDTRNERNRRLKYRSDDEEEEGELSPYEYDSETEEEADNECAEIRARLLEARDPGLEIRKEGPWTSQDFRLYATRRFEAGEPITAYDGLLVPASRVMHMNQERIVDHIRNKWYIAGLSDERGTPIHWPHIQLAGYGVGSMAADDGSYANADLVHIDCKKNLELIAEGKEPDPRFRITFLRARRTIRPGREITLNYDIL